MYIKEIAMIEIYVTAVVKINIYIFIFRQFIFAFPLCFENFWIIFRTHDGIFCFVINLTF